MLDLTHNVHSPLFLPHFSDYWERFERYVRDLTRRADSVYVVTGPLWMPRPDSDGRWMMQHPCIGARGGGEGGGREWGDRWDGREGECVGGEGRGGRGEGRQALHWYQEEGVGLLMGCKAALLCFLVSPSSRHVCATLTPLTLQVSPS